MAVSQYQPMERRSDTARSSTGADPETCLLADLARLEWLHSPSPIERLVITDSIAATEAVRLSHNIRQLTIAPLIAEAMRRISEERSVSSLFD